MLEKHVFIILLYISYIYMCVLMCYYNHNVFIRFFSREQSVQDFFLNLRFLLISQEFVVLLWVNLLRAVGDLRSYFDTLEKFTGYL